MSKPKKPRTFTTAECLVTNIRNAPKSAGVRLLAAYIARTRKERDAAVRRARGRTVGWCVKPVFQNVKGGWKGGEVHSLLTRLRTPYDGCRVVLVPRRSR